MKPDDDARLLAAALAEQRACYEEMLGFAEGQRDTLLMDDPNPLLDLVRRKQGVMERLEAIARRTAAARERWPGVRDAAAPALRAEVDSRADEVAAVLTRLIASEEEAARMAGALRDETLGRLKKQADTQKLRSAYGPKDGGDARLFDTKES
ncbi:MAG: hypothetical protein AAB434_06580 [Planctomycetota bacterium]